MMDIVDVAILLVVCQKSDFHGNSDFQNSQKLYPLQIAAKKFLAKICEPFKHILGKEIDTWCFTRVK
jgi:hypothetical protein